MKLISLLTAHLIGCRGDITSDEIPPPPLVVGAVLFADVLFKILWRSLSYPS